MKDIYNDKDRDGDFDVNDILAGPEILKEEVEHAMKRIKKDNSAGPDKIPIEMYEALEKFGIEQLTSLLNKMYNTGEIPEDLLKSSFIVLPKKPGANRE